MTCAAVVLAAGGGRRYGMPKALVEYEGSLLVERAVRTAQAVCDPVLVVLAAGGGRRYGMPKALVEYEGSLLVERAVRTARAACDDGGAGHGAHSPSGLTRPVTGRRRPPRRP